MFAAESRVWKSDGPAIFSRGRFPLSLGKASASSWSLCRGLRKVRRALPMIFHLVLKKTSGAETCRRYIRKALKMSPRIYQMFPESGSLSDWLIDFSEPVRFPSSMGDRKVGDVSHTNQRRRCKRSGARPGIPVRNTRILHGIFDHRHRYERAYCSLERRGPPTVRIRTR